MNDKYNIEMLYPLMEIAYIKAMGRDPKGENDPVDDLFPLGWYSEFDYSTRIAILKEAVEKKVLIIDTELYLKNSEGVRNSL